MRFPYPCFPAEFDIPDEWLAEAGMDGFVACAPSYSPKVNATLVNLVDIEPPPRWVTCPHDFRGFEKVRLIRILTGIASGSEIDPVDVVKLAPRHEFIRIGYDYQVNDGFHRYHASVAAGFTQLPVRIVDQRC